MWLFGKDVDHILTTEKILAEVCDLQMLYMWFVWQFYKGKPLSI